MVWRTHSSILTLCRYLTYLWSCSSGIQNPFIGFIFQTSSQVLDAPFGSSPFSLFSGGITAPVSVTPTSTGIIQTKYNTLQVSNPLHFGWNPFQNIATSSQLVARCNSNISFGKTGVGTSQPQNPQYQLPSQTHLPFFTTLNLPDLSKLINDSVHHDATWPPVPIKLPSDIPKFEGKTGEDVGAHITTFHLWCSSNSLNDDFIRLRLFQ